TGTFLINPKTTTDGDVTTQVTPNNQAITFGDTPDAFTATFGSNLNDVTLTNNDFTFADSGTHTAVTGIPKNAGSYEISLTAAAQARIKTANPNYTFSAGSFKTGTFTIKPKDTTADDVTTQVKVNDHSIVYGDPTPTFDLTYGDKLTAATGLTNADFSFTDDDGNSVTGVPENVGSYKVSLNASGQAKVQAANGNYTLTADDFTAGKFTITAKSTTPNDATTEVTANGQTITFGDTPKAFTATFGSKLNSVDLTNDDFVFTVGTTTVDGVPTNAGTYTISLTTAAQNRIKAANPNYKFSDKDFKAGTFLINPKATTDDDETTQVKVNDHSIVYGDSTPTFDLTYGDKLTAATGLTNADFSFKDSDSNMFTGVPENVGVYTVSLNASGQAKVQQANGNYTLEPADFLTGTFKITAKSTTPNDATTEVTADSQTITFGDTPRAFTATFGGKLNHVTLTDADFTFTDNKTNTEVDGVPTNAGNYKVSLTADAQARIETANPNYTFSAGDFKPGTFTINQKTTTADDVTTQAKVNNQSKVYGDKDPNFDLTYGDKLTAPTNLTNADFSFEDSDGNTVTGVPENVGTYTVSLNATGQVKVQAANGNYKLTADDFKNGTFTIIAKSTTQNDATTEVTADSQTITFGDTPKAFTATFGDKLNHVTLTDADFTFTDTNTYAAVDGIPTNAGSYKISLTADAQARIKTANPNYTFSNTDFKTGTFTINQKATTADDVTTQAKVNNQSKVYGDKDPKFDLTYGDKLTAPTNLTNADFSFKDSDGNMATGVPENVGSYTVSLNADGQAKVQAANGNYALTAEDFKAGKFTIMAKPTTPDDVTTEAKVNDQTKVYGDKDPNFDLIYGDKLNAATDLTNADFSFKGSNDNVISGIPENVGTYTVSLTADGQAKVQKSNGNYALTAEDFKPGTFTITAKTTTKDDVTTEATVNDQTKVYGDKDPSFDLTYGDKLNAATDLTNADFSFTDSKNHAVDGVPENVGSYTVSLNASGQAKVQAANGNYALTAEDFKAGKFTITAKSTTPDDVTTEAKVNDQTKVYGDKGPNFDLTYGDKLNAATDLTNADFSFTDSKNHAVDGVPENVGTYTVSLNADGQAKVQAANGNYTLTAEDFKAGKFTITAKTTTKDDVTTEATVNDQSKVYGDKDPNFDLTYGDKLNAATDLTNADFSFTDSKDHAVDGIPENVGTYTVSLNANGQAKVQAANGNYALTADNFKPGSFTITAKTTTKDDVTTEAKVNDQTKVYGDKDPNFDLTYGDKLNAATDLTNADFSFTDSKNHAVDGVPENVGTYTVSLNASGQAKVQAANGNYTLTADDFKPGTFTITAKSTTKDDVTTQATVNDQSKVYGDPTPTFDLTYGDKLTATTGLTNTDFSFTDIDGNAISGIPENVGTYKVSLNADGQAKVQAANGNYALTADDFKTGKFTITAKPTTTDDATTEVTTQNEVINEGDPVPTFTVSYGSKLINHPVLTNADFSFDGSDTIPTAAGIYTVTLNALGKKAVQDANPNYALTDADFVSGTFTINKVTTDPDGGKTITKTDGSGAIIQIEKDWGDGDKTVVDIDTDTNVATVTETPNGKPSLTPVTVKPGESVKTGKTTVANNEPANGVSLTHDAPGTATDGTPTTGTTGEVVTPDGTRTYFKSSNGEGVSTTSDNYYTTGTTDDPFGGKTITKTDGSGAIIQIEKDWPDGDKTVVDIDKTTGNTVVTETPNGQPSLTPVTVEPGKNITVGKTTVDNNEPNGGITLTHETPGTATDGTPTTGTTGEVVTPDGKHSYFKSSNGEGVSTTADDYYTNTTTDDPNGGRPLPRLTVPAQSFKLKKIGLMVTRR
ncbi:MAG TPA: hypothetical protein DDW71_06260, partial [Lactobacillus sp.]|nr:hypothetical protein [Lactobacillus sp.]